MDSKSLGILVVALVIGAFLVWKFVVKPHKITHDSTILFTGGLGSGKTKSSVSAAIKSIKAAVSAWRRAYFWALVKWRLFGVFKNEPKPERGEKPILFSNIPVRWGWPWARSYSYQLTREMFLFKERIPCGSVVLVDELPQFANQFEWANPLVQNEVNEFFTFFRHYVGGVFIANAQSLDEVESHIRRKLNCYYYCFDFSPILWLFYRMRVLKCRVGDVSVSLDSDFLDDNAKWVYGTFLFKHYESRCYRHRYDSVLWTGKCKPFNKLYTNRVLKLDPNRKSVLDDHEADYD